MEPPTPPNEEDCCNSCCNPCIFDVYEAKLKKFNNTIAGEPSTLKNCISDTSYSVFKLLAKELHTKDTYILTFQYVKQHRKDVELSHENLGLYFKPGQHFLLYASLYNNKEQLTRAYTPLLSDNLEKLQFKVLIKLYEHGFMSKYIRRLKIDAETLWRGPYGDFEIKYLFRHVLMIAQGVGIAPLYSVIKEMLRDENFESFIKLFFCCRNSGDILLRDEIYKLASYWNFEYEVFLSNSELMHKKYNEIVNTKRLANRDLSNYLKDKDCKQVQILICGSKNFGQSMLDLLGEFDRSNIYLF